jgi:archaemetzincin
MIDLYPHPTWNFVFGQASLSERTGVFSFARFDPAFFGQKRPEEHRDLIFRRSCKTLAHELAHTFGLQHCIYHECLVNGSNHQREADSRPQHLCPICLRKLHHAVGFDPVARYEALAEFYGRHGWSDEESWVQGRLAPVRILDLCPPVD